MVGLGDKSYLPSSFFFQNNFSQSSNPYYFMKKT